MSAKKAEKTASLNDATTYEKKRVASIEKLLSLTGIMEPPMIGVMEPRVSSRKRVSVNSQINVFHPLSQVLILVFLKWKIFAFLAWALAPESSSLGGRPCRRHGEAGQW